MIARYRGEYEIAVEICNQSWELGRTTGMPWCEVFPLGTLGSVYQDISAELKDEAVRHHDQAMKLLDLPMGAMAGGFAWADIGFCFLANGLVDEAEDAFGKGLELPTPHRLINRPRYLTGMAYVKFLRGERSEALDLVLEAGDYAETRAMKYLFPELALAQGRIRVALGEQGEALAQFRRAESSAREMGMRPAIWQALVEQARAYSSLGRAAEALERQSAAADIVNEMARMFDDAKLRDAFEQSARPAVETLVAGPLSV